MIEEEAVINDTTTGTPRRDQTTEPPKNEQITMWTVKAIQSI